LKFGVISIWIRFRGFFNIARFGIFPQFGSYLAEKTEQTFMKILLYVCLRTKTSLLNFGRNPAPNQYSELVIRTALTLANVCAVAIERTVGI